MAPSPDLGDIHTRTGRHLRPEQVAAIRAEFAADLARCGLNEADMRDARGRMKPRVLGMWGIPSLAVRAAAWGVSVCCISQVLAGRTHATRPGDVQYVYPLTERGRTHRGPARMRVLAARREGVTLAELARREGVTLTTVARWVQEGDEGVVRAALPRANAHTTVTRTRVMELLAEGLTVRVVSVRTGVKETVIWAWKAGRR